MKTGHEYLLAYFPDYDYHKPKFPERLDYRREDNIVGFQQRAFVIYWALKGAENGGIGLDVGCGRPQQILRRSTRRPAKNLKKQRRYYLARR